jgi:hypothetical protein
MELTLVIFMDSYCANSCTVLKGLMTESCIFAAGQAAAVMTDILLSCCSSDIKGALTSLLRTFSADDGGSEATSKGDKIAAVARDGADQRPVSATPSTLGGVPPGRRRTKQDVYLEAGAVGSEQGSEPHQPNAPRTVIERSHAHLKAAQES